MAGAATEHTASTAVDPGPGVPAVDPALCSCKMDQIPARDKTARGHTNARPIPPPPINSPPPLCDTPSGCCSFTGALDSHPFFPSHVASGRCFLSAAAAGAPAGVVSAFAEPSSWCVGAVLNVAGGAVCVSAAPNSWRIEDVLVVAGVV